MSKICTGALQYFTYSTSLRIVAESQSCRCKKGIISPAPSIHLVSSLPHLHLFPALPELLSNPAQPVLSALSDLSPIRVVHLLHRLF